MRLSLQAPQAEASEERPFATVQTGLKGAAVVVDGVLRALKVSPFSGDSAIALVLKVSHVHFAIAVVLKVSHVQSAHAVAPKQSTREGAELSTPR